LRKIVGRGRSTWQGCLGLFNSSIALIDQCSHQWPLLPQPVACSSDCCKLRLVVKTHSVTTQQCQGGAGSWRIVGRGERSTGQGCSGMFDSAVAWIDQFDCQRPALLQPFACCSDCCKLQLVCKASSIATHWCEGVGNGFVRIQGCWGRWNELGRVWVMSFNLKSLFISNHSLNKYLHTVVIR